MSPRDLRTRGHVSRKFERQQRGVVMCRIYVKRNEFQRFDTLYHAFRTSIPGADVVWDRRVRERRTRNAAVSAVDRRWSERRTAPPESWSALGFVVMQSPSAATVRRKAPLSISARVAPAPRPMSRPSDPSAPDPTVAEIRGTFVRIAENLVGEIVRRLQAPPEVAPQGPIETLAMAGPRVPATLPPMPTPPMAGQSEAYKLQWPPLAERN
jgi:hypothetical protein